MEQGAAGITEIRTYGGWTWQVRLCDVAIRLDDAIETRILIVKNSYKWKKHRLSTHDEQAHQLMRAYFEHRRKCTICCFIY